MARPIEPTPILIGKDADRLLSDMDDVCPPAEAKSRIDEARRIRAEMMSPKVNLPNRRAREKQESRDRDAARLASGEVSREQLREENAFLQADRSVVHFDRIGPLR